MGLVGIRKKGKDGRREKSLTKCALHLSLVCQLAPTVGMVCKVLVGALPVLTYQNLLDRLSGGPTCCELAKSTLGGFSQRNLILMLVTFFKNLPPFLCMPQEIGLCMPQEIWSYMMQHLL